jgi:hypothetical protein
LKSGPSFLSCFLTALLFSSGIVHADVIRCEIVDRSHRLMPEWIEYELNERGTVVEIRDSVGAQFDVG